MVVDLVEAIFQALELIITLDPEVMQITILSLRVSLTAVLIATIIGLPAGMILGSRNFLGKRMLLTLIHTWMSFPPVVMGLLIFILFSNIGPFGILNILLTDTAMMLAQFFLALPILIGLSASAVGNLDPQILEAATTLGANPRQKIILLLRETRIGLLAATIAAFGGAISE
ncbi:MAG: ABC transporter permease, partial [Candidatus Hodarchaeales archaeon]